MSKGKITEDELSNSLLDIIKGGGKNLIFSPNYIYNSTFGRFNSNLKPDYWNTNSTVSNAYSYNGDYSLYMKKGEYCYQDSIIGTELLDTSKWSTLYTRYSFNFLGKGSLKVSLWSGNSKIKFKVGNNNTYVDEFIYTVDSAKWDDSSNYITVDPNNITLQLRFECTDGYIYLDSVMGCPIENESDITVYQDGPMCENDTMTIVDSDLVDAKIGDMWFVRKGE